MKLIVEKSRLKGEILIPGSKSHTIRSVVMASVGRGKSIISNPLVSSDTLSSVSCFRSLGADIDTSRDDQWVILGTGGKVLCLNDSIDVGNSGTTLRLAASICGLAEAEDEIILTGDNQIKSRPIEPLLSSLRDLGAKAESINNDGCAPVRISGKLRGGRTKIDCVTSQYLSSLLFACPLAESDTEIEVGLLNEPDYVSITLDWLDKQQIEYQNEDMKRFKIKGAQSYKAMEGTIAADFSSATFFLCAGAVLDGDISIKGLDFNDSQPDKAVVDYLRKMGANIAVDSEGTVHVKGSELEGVELDMNRTPDALPAMAVTAALAKGQSRLYNVPQARNKETDRISCMASELCKLNVDAEELPDGLIINPKSDLQAGAVDGKMDHRIVMALSIAGMAINGKTTINDAEAMNVTFPDYVEKMQLLGANIELKQSA
jgi:3-phosphoshikimate 1-carboxyvinyltransferase